VSQLVRQACSASTTRY